MPLEGFSSRKSICHCCSSQWKSHTIWSCCFSIKLSIPFNNSQAPALCHPPLIPLVLLTPCKYSLHWKSWTIWVEACQHTGTSYMYDKLKFFSVYSKKVLQERVTHKRSLLSPWDNGQLWVLGFVQGSIQEQAIVKWKSFFSWSK